MAFFAKVSAYFLLAVLSVSAARDSGDCGAAAGASASAPATSEAGGQQNRGPDLMSLLGKIGPAKEVTVNYPAAAMTPIHYISSDYNGPYDPFDPKGKTAAVHRLMKIKFDQEKENFLSYIPPDLNKHLKREGIKFAMAEGERFAFAHPKETAELAGIFTRGKKLYKNAMDQAEKYEEKLEKAEKKGEKREKGDKGKKNGKDCDKN